MSPFREFLETSNLHGLVHISKAESMWGRILWTISVIASFTIASIQINSSFSQWSNQPISSLITTHPIKALKFPNVTVCPPKGTNTALNYDLTRLDTTFKPSEEEKIQDETKSIFTGNHTDLVLQEFFLNQTSPRSLLQGLANVINSGLIDSSANLKHLRQFCQMLSAVLRLDVPYILTKTLSLMDIQAMKNEENPFLIFNSSTSEERDKKRENLMAELSSHPVHLTSKNAPSAFIPFCAYQTDLEIFGDYIDGLDIPVCNKFTPTVHRGQLCYKIDVGSLLPDVETKNGKAGALTLLLDYNTERSVHPKTRSQTKKDIRNTHLNLEDDPDEYDGEATIFFHTIQRVKGFGGGSYTMNVLKQVAPTERFLQLPEAVKGCTDDDKEHCRMTTYLDQKQQECSCVPWEFPNIGESKVNPFAKTTF